MHKPGGSFGGGVARFAMLAITLSNHSDRLCVSGTVLFLCQFSASPLPKNGVPCLARPGMNAIQESTASNPRCAHAHGDSCGTARALLVFLSSSTLLAGIPRDQEDKLIELVRQCATKSSARATPLPAVGYTYFGQFLGHDLTHRQHSLEDRTRSGRDSQLSQFPSFDLDHIYGGGPENRRFFMREKEGSGDVQDRATTPAGYRRDLPVGARMVLIGDLQDTRNLDNLILRQLHVVFLKFHNEAIRQIGSPPPTITELRTWDWEHCSNAPKGSCAGITSGSFATITCRGSCTPTFGITRSERVPPGIPETCRRATPFRSSSLAGRVPIRAQHGA